MGELAPGTGASAPPRASPRVPREAVVAFALALLMRLCLVERQGLWPDEVFSLAIATGHSLEHPAEQAEAALGDFVEDEPAFPAVHYQRYLANGSEPEGPRRVLRAVRLSDTSPPLYYLLLQAWTRLAGTGDASLRTFSVFWAMACLPLLWLVSTRIGGRVAAPAACVLFAFAPLSIYYSTEGRMYSLLWFWVLSAAWLMLRLRDVGTKPAALAGWIAASAGGLLTHYFFGFVWLAMLLWWLGSPGLVGRRWLLLAAALAGLAVLPWYLSVPEDLGRWRVTGDWLRMRPSGYAAERAPFQLALSYVSSRGVWGGGPRAERAGLVLYALSGAALVWGLGRRALRAPVLLLWLWLAGACLGPPLLDWLRGTYSAAVPRYALAGMPAAFLLMALGVGALPARARWAFLVLALASWTPGWKLLFANPSRSFSPLREVARELSARATASDVVVVHSIPSGVIGVARYMDGGAPIAAWVGQLGRRRVPESVETLLAGRAKAFLVLIHTVGEPAPEEGYLREHAQTVRDEWLETARIVEFAPRDADRFPTPQSILR
jgi:hypothetical protein